MIIDLYGTYLLLECVVGRMVDHLLTEKVSEKDKINAVNTLATHLYSEMVNWFLCYQPSATIQHSRYLLLQHVRQMLLSYSDYRKENECNN